MEIGIIVAMGSELEMLLREMPQHNQQTINGFTFYTGTIGRCHVAAMQCGIGKVNAAVGALTLIEQFAPELIINTGIAGGTGQGAGVLDVVVGTEVGYHDVWCGPGNARGQVQGLPERFRGAVDALCIPRLIESGKLIAGTIASGDLFVSTPEDLKGVLATVPDAIAVDMESGAIAQVCHLKGGPFVAIRVISDTPGAENHLEQYADFWNLAPQSTFGILREILDPQ